MNYAGPSMNPTLKAGDGLSVIPYGNRKICIGDVVVFRNPENKYNVAHRVISVDPHEIRTQGDNNKLIDSWLLHPEDIIGRVVSVQRNNRYITIHGATRGRITALSLRAKKQISSAISRILHPIYHRLARSGIFIKYNRFLPKTQVLIFNRPNGKELQLCMGKHIIGRYLPENDQWQIKRPFRLFFIESSLPK